MILDRRQFVAAVAVGLAGGHALHSLPGGAVRHRTILEPRSPQPPVAHVPPPRPALLDEALAALARHGSRIPHRDRIALVDFAHPSSEARMLLVNVESGLIERSWLVAHGNGSDPAATGMLHSFSNRSGSNATSEGAFLVAETYHGKHGRSQRVLGLDPTNDAALSRSIVIHGADYVNPSLIASQGRIGRSQGCFAVEPSCIDPVIARLGAGRMLYSGKSA